VAGAKLTIPVLLVPHADIPAMERAYGHSMLPATYLIDREGRIRSRFLGLARHEVLLEEIAEFLGPPAPAPPAAAPGSEGAAGAGRASAPSP